MKLLKKENWWMWLMLAFLSGGSSILVLGALLDVYDEDAWYYRWTKKLPKPFLVVVLCLIGIVLFISSISFLFALSVDISDLGNLLGGIAAIFFLIYTIIIFMVTIFQIQILAQVNAKLRTPGSEIYLSPYIWILGLIIPIIGWILLIVMYLYLQIWYLVMLYRGEGE